MAKSSKKTKTAEVVELVEEPAVETEEETPEKPEQPANLIKKKELYDHVTVATGLRKREVREAIDATLAYLHECLSDGKDVQCPPLGKLKVITRGEGEDAKILYKLALQKQGNAKAENAEVAEAAEAE